MNANLSSLVAVVLVSGCQTGTSEPERVSLLIQTTQSRTVTARALKPNAMILLDRSDAMKMPLTPASCSCVFPDCDEATCPTGMGRARSVMSELLGMNGALAHVGLTVFPHGDLCEPPGASDVLSRIIAPSARDADLQAAARAVNDQLVAVSPGGGAPVSGALSFVGQMPELNDPTRENFVVLVTAGVPSCNPANPNTCLDLSSCQCTVGAGSCGTILDDADPNNWCRRGCLDRDGTVEAMLALRRAGIRTIVVGVGSAVGTLNEMAIAGGFFRTCPFGTNAECGTGDTCLSSRVCQQGFYTSAGELAAQLGAPPPGDSWSPCDYVLEALPASQDFVSVSVDGMATPPGDDTWGLYAGAVRFTGPLCERLAASTILTPVRIEVRIVQFI